MRVPDLDWPVDLFKDAIIVVPETVTMLSVPFRPEPTLWEDMVSAWTTPANAQSSVPVLHREQPGF